MRLNLLLVPLFLLATATTVMADTDFCEGYYAGYADAYKEKHRNNPNRPNCPNLPNSAQGQHNGNNAYKIGYRMGVRDGDRQ